jgi:hypothetical protein
MQAIGEKKSQFQSYTYDFQTWHAFFPCMDRASVKASMHVPCQRGQFPPLYALQYIMLESV